MNRWKVSAHGCVCNRRIRRSAFRPGNNISCQRQRKREKERLVRIYLRYEEIVVVVKELTVSLSLFGELVRCILHSRIPVYTMFTRRRAHRRLFTPAGLFSASSHSFFNVFLSKSYGKREGERDKENEANIGWVKNEKKRGKNWKVATLLISPFLCRSHHRSEHFFFCVLSIKIVGILVVRKSHRYIIVSLRS